MKTKVILKTEHGSWLYGLARPDSDHDFYEIYDFLNHNWRPKRQTKQQINGDLDEVRISLDRFKDLCFKGVPQSIEVLFAPPDAWVVVEDSWHSISDRIKLELTDHMPTILDTYKRTAMNFFFSKKDTAKKRRHAFRLLTNAKQLKTTGQMNSRLSADQIALINELHTSYDSEDKFKDMIYEIF